MANVSDLAESHSPESTATRRAGLSRNMTEVVDYYHLETLEGGCVGTEDNSQEITSTTPGGGDEREGLLVTGPRGEGRRSPSALRVHFEKTSITGGGEEEEEDLRPAVKETVM